LAAGDDQQHVAHKPQPNPRLASGPAQPRYLTEEKNNASPPHAIEEAGGAAAGRYQWRGADAAGEIDSSAANAAESTGNSPRSPSSRYPGRYSESGRAADLLPTEQDDPLAQTSAEEDPFPMRGDSNPAAAALLPPNADPWAHAGDNRVAPRSNSPAETPADRATSLNPLRLNVAPPATLTAAELPADASVNGSRRGRYDAETGTTVQSPPNPIQIPANAQQNQLAANDPAGTNQDLAVVQHTQSQQPQYPQYQQQYQQTSQRPSPDAAYDPVDPAASIAPGTYVVGPNDNYWAISAAVYGTGKYFKALFEHNRHRYPAADDLHVGDSLDVPPLAKLEESYPDLCPKRRRSSPQARGYTASTGGSAARGGQVYEVQEGDTLFNIARERLGRAARWAEIYELNRDRLGDDIDFVSPGMQLTLPADTAPPQDIITRRPGQSLHR
jgi:nucleoid-associated protein YgaU